MCLEQNIKLMSQSCPPSLPAISLAGQSDIRQAGLGQGYAKAFSMGGLEKPPVANNSADLTGLVELN